MEGFVAHQAGVQRPWNGMKPGADGCIRCYLLKVFSLQKRRRSYCPCSNPSGRTLELLGGAAEGGHA